MSLPREEREGGWGSFNRHSTSIHIPDSHTRGHRGRAAQVQVAQHCGMVRHHCATGQHWLSAVEGFSIRALCRQLSRSRAQGHAWSTSARCSSAASSSAGSSGKTSMALAGGMRAASPAVAAVPVNPEQGGVRAHVSGNSNHWVCTSSASSSHS